MSPLIAATASDSIGGCQNSPKRKIVLAWNVYCYNLMMMFSMLQACMAGIVFAKFTKPTNRAETILFSTNALITLRNGSYYLSCRIGDMR